MLKGDKGTWYLALQKLEILRSFIQHAWGKLSLQELELCCHFLKHMINSVLRSDEKSEIPLKQKTYNLTVRM